MRFNLMRCKDTKNLRHYATFCIIIYYVASQQPTAMTRDATTNVKVTGSPSSRIDSKAPTKGARA